MPLKGVKIVEFVGLAPGPFCGMLLTDFGATVTRIDRTSRNYLDVLQNGKRSIALDLKKPKAIEIVRSMCKVSDVLIEPFRPGVMEKLGLGPEVLMKDNPRLIYSRLTGFGQTGPYASRAGHDINYVALSGILSLFGRRNEKPTPPINFAADFAGGGLLCAFGILAALLERHNSGQGQIVDHAMVEGAAYVGSWLMRSQQLPVWGNKRGENALDSGAHFYDTYKTKDGKFMSVGAVESQFYKLLLEGLNLPEEITQYEDFEKKKKILEQVFLTKTQKEWTNIFDSTDACVFPVLEMHEAADYSHNKARNAFADTNKTNGEIVPMPAPKLSRTPPISGALKENVDEYKVIEEIFDEIAVPREDITKLTEEGVLLLNTNAKL